MAGMQQNETHHKWHSTAPLYHHAYHPVAHNSTDKRRAGCGPGTALLLCPLLLLTASLTYWPTN